MNPHFIFNALNSIKLYIINNNKEEAAYYLTKFSKLIRVILEATEKKSVVLKEELETMKLYLKIENIRFDDMIQFKININKQIDLEKIKIPPLLLQPFLENAIWHGLSTKKGEKIIIINVTKNNKDFLDINILDNGVGRVTSEKGKKQKYFKTQSFGIKLSKERLLDFTKEYKYDFAISYKDLYDKDKNPKGTKVKLRIPLI